MRTSFFGMQIDEVPLFKKIPTVVEKPQGYKELWFYEEEPMIYEVGGEKKVKFAPNPEGKKVRMYYS